MGRGHVRGTQENLERETGSGYDCIALYTCMNSQRNNLIF